MNKYNTTPI